MNSATQFTNLIQAEAHNLGFSLVGVTSPTTPWHINTYKEWIANRQHAGMAYLARDSAILRREDPGSNLEGCRSIIVLGFPYPGPSCTPAPADHFLRGRVASYAWGLDYHLVVTQRAELLAGFLRSLSPHSRHKVYTDTGPILERDLALMAGLGWIGKNTCLISPSQGSYFFLAEIFTDLSLDVTAAFTKEHCGTCRKCIEICPTQSILPNRTINSSTCISYLTIENKEEIPPHLRSAMENWVFGCDLCQAVCPWNSKHHHQSGDAQLTPSPETAFPDLLSSLALTAEQFKARFSQSPIQRAKRDGYLRNIATALGNTGDPGTFSAISAAIKTESSPMVRDHLYWALSKTDPQRSKQQLEIFKKAENEIPLRLRIEQYLQNCSSF